MRLEQPDPFGEFSVKLLKEHGGRGGEICDRSAKTLAGDPVPLGYSHRAFCQMANLQLLHESLRTGRTEIACEHLGFLLRCVLNCSPARFSPLLVKERKAEGWPCC